MKIAYHSSTHIGIENNFILKQKSDLVSAHLLQKVENVNLLTDLELLELKKQWCGEAFDAGFEKCGENMIDHLIEVSKPLPDKETFLNNIKL